MDDLTFIRKCNCNRSWCQYFAPGAGEEGLSFSFEELECEIKNQMEHIEQAKKNIRAIKKVIKQHV